MNLPIYAVSSFADSTFSGNPAAVVVTKELLADELMQSIAAQNNLAETAFVLLGEDLQLRWFSPAVEVDLCGHATLAAAFVLWEQGYSDGDELNFRTQSGRISVKRDGELLQLNFPARPATPVELDKQRIADALGCGAEDIEEILESRSLTVVLSTEATLQRLQPDVAQLRTLHPWAVLVTAAGREVDFVARFFAPNIGVDEDPVTGSAYTTLAPFWATRLGKTRLRARQLSRRGGEILCELAGDRVLIAGKVCAYLKGEIVV